LADSEDGASSVAPLRDRVVGYIRDAVGQGQDHHPNEDEVQAQQLVIPCFAYWLVRVVESTDAHTKDDRNTSDNGKHHGRSRFLVLPVPILGADQDQQSDEVQGGEQVSPNVCRLAVHHEHRSSALVHGHFVGSTVTEVDILALTVVRACLSSIFTLALQLIQVVNELFVTETLL